MSSQSQRDKPKVIGITGAKGTGKSHLISQFSNEARLIEGFNLHFIESPGKKLSQSTTKLGMEGNDETHLQFAAAHIRNILSCRCSSLIYLLDRCIVDHIAYTNLLSDSQSLKSLMFELGRLYAPHVTGVLVLPFDDLARRNVYETESIDFRKTVHEEILVVCSQLEISHCLLDNRNSLSRQAANSISMMVRNEDRP